MRIPLVLFAASFLMDGCMAIFNLALPQYAATLGLSPEQIGIAKGASTLPYALVCVLTGALGDRIGWRPVAVVGCFSFGICFLLVTKASGLPILIIACIGVSLCQSLFWPPFEGMCGGGHTGARLSRQLVPLNVSWSLGYMGGLLLCGYLISVAAKLPFYAAAGGAILAGVVVLLFRPTAAEQRDDQEVEEISVPAAVHRRFTQAHRLANFASYFCIAAVLTYFPARGKELELGPRTISNLVFILGAIRVAVFFVMGHWRGWHYRAAVTMIAQFAGLCGLIGLTVGTTPLVIMTSLGCIGLMTGVTYFGSMHYSVSSKDSLGQRAGWHECVLRLGEFFGGTIGGFVVGYYDQPRMAFVSALGVVGIAMASSALLMRKSNS